MPKTEKLDRLKHRLRMQLLAAEQACPLLHATPEQYSRVRLYRQAVRRVERLT